MTARANLLYNVWVDLVWGGFLTKGATPSSYQDAAPCFHNQGYMDGGRQGPACLSGYVDISQSRYIANHPGWEIDRQFFWISGFVDFSYSY